MGVRRGVQVNFTLSREARAVLQELLDHQPWGHSKLIERLIFEHAARLEERQRLREEARRVEAPA